MEDVFAAVDARPKRRQGVTGQTIEAQMRGTMCQITEYELDMLRDEIARLTAERDALRAENERLRETLRPFAKAGELFDEDQGTVEFDQCVYRPAIGKEWSIYGDDLRHARIALEKGGE